MIVDSIAAPLRYTVARELQRSPIGRSAREENVVVITEESRQRLYRRLEETLGREEATILMEYLPPVGWADVATKRDLDHFAERLELKLESGLNGVRADFHRDLRLQLITTIASQTAIATMLVAAVKLI